MPIIETIFGPKQYLTLRKIINVTQINDKQLYDEAGRKLGDCIERNGLTHTGGWSILYFFWDEPSNKAEIGISVPIISNMRIDDPEISVINIPKTKASMDKLHGPYERLGIIHKSLMNHVSINYDSSFVPVMAIEEYVINPESNPESWETRVYYLHN